MLIGGKFSVLIDIQEAKAMYNKGVTLGQLNRSEEAIAVYDGLLERYGERSEAGIVEVVGKAIEN